MTFFRPLFGSLALFAITALGAGCNNTPGTPVCATACIAGSQLCCDDGSGTLTGRCVNFTSDPANCGGCGVSCAGAPCIAGSCSIAMVDAGRDAPFTPTDARADSPISGCVTRMCGDVTVNCGGFTGAPNADGTGDPSFMHCGVCGRACNAETASRCARLSASTTETPDCYCGAFRCGATETCVLEGATYICVNTDTDEDNCGEIGHACAESETCVAGICSCGSVGDLCSEGEECCGAGIAAMCIPTGDDDNNCGGCGIVCMDNTECTEGECTCEIPTDTDPLNCGACGNACVENELCEAGICECQLPTDDDEMNCGDCGVVCGTGQECIAGECRCGDDVCDPVGPDSLGDLCCPGSDGTPACVPNDAMNCGECGNECESGPFGGRCGLGREDLGGPLDTVCCVGPAFMICT